jgi:hypothetical protein
MANSVAMLQACGRGQAAKFDGPACERCGEKATEMLGAAPLCFEHYGQEQVARLRRFQARRDDQ